MLAQKTACVKQDSKITVVKYQFFIYVFNPCLIHAQYCQLTVANNVT